MKYRLIKEFSEIKESFASFELDCRKILTDYEIKSNHQLNDRITDWSDKVLSHVKAYVKPLPKFLEDHFRYGGVNSPLEDRLFHPTYEENTKDDYFSQRIDERIKNLYILLDYFRILRDIHQNPPSAELEIQDKFDFLLNKLYNAFNDNFYSISFILDLAGITYRNDEPRELGQVLYKKGYVASKDYFGDSDFVKLTVKGASYVERKNKADVKKQVQKIDAELNMKVDIVLEKLQKLGYGQQIIFKEIEELKSLSGKLKKRTWVQLLKGKVIDLAMEQVINKETATYILETLTEGASKMLIK